MSIAAAFDCLTLGESAAQRGPKGPGWWIAALAAVALIALLQALGCSSERLPENYRAALTLTAQESATDLHSRSKCDLAPGYTATVRVVCDVLSADAHQGRGWVEWLVGAAGLTSGPSGDLDTPTKKACAEVGR